ncbi:MAG: hypothetical protein LBK69_00270 [Syntrophomonadaceae bacterium]|nr:hypothetical protein [Syntrophomonadaceae bacterium]
MERIEKLLAVMGHPEQGMAYVHIAGTNGKGSVSSFVAETLLQAGYKVGKFTSPHIFSYQERFVVNGKTIAAETLINYLKNINKHIVSELDEIYWPTEFEKLTAAAFAYFFDEKVDIVVLEVGMGGRFDSTNVIEPEAAVITNTELDHLTFLGNTRSLIAENKAGIIKRNVPLITGNIHPEAWPVISQRIQEQNAPLYSISDVNILKNSLNSDLSRNLVMQYQNETIEITSLSLRGGYQIENAAVAFLTCLVLKNKGYIIKTEHITTAFSRTYLPGRLEILQNEPMIIADAAHNGHGAAALAKSLNELYPRRQKILICTLLDDKDKFSFLTPLLENTKFVIFTNPNTERSKHWREWPSIDGFNSNNIEGCENISEAFAIALKMLQNDDYMLVSGSFYMLAPIIDWVKHFYK